MASKNSITLSFAGEGIQHNASRDTNVQRVNSRLRFTTIIPSNITPSTSRNAHESGTRASDKGAQAST